MNTPDLHARALVFCKQHQCADVALIEAAMRVGAEDAVNYAFNLVRDVRLDLMAAQHPVVGPTL